MGSYENVGWNLVEEAVICDRGYDEETVLASILQSYFIKQGFVESLQTLNEELRELQTMTETRVAKTKTAPAIGTKAAAGCRVKRKSKGNYVKQEELHNGDASHEDEKNLGNGNRKNSGMIYTVHENAVDCVGAETVLESMKKRKHLQLLCLNGRYEEAAALLPQGSVFIVKLLAMEAIKRARKQPSAALLFLCEGVGPLVAGLSDAAMAHRIYINTLAVITGADTTEWSVPSPCKIAREVNESLLEDHEPSALHVLLSWAEWQEIATAKGEDMEDG
ncbi:hypothetical protein TraAM80_06959 [Trypanosoma rangeli]|uniref:Uncharacterized protein n=1 Tax=Trypanosoma rangeli TaxID=5698 RepID=A0A422N813_TRYRA|nr:uncharacterized protein TraAM80_06959 [Trypanosoma rangeli]RNF01566.1 hypothetical protein TraAM80_06959 [Trypanosoma rangeli]|eukprot:RNF01566.1 hypothetical protein TraAM80_06959 [Trypanosoma rangeli]